MTRLWGSLVMIAALALPAAAHGQGFAVGEASRGFGALFEIPSGIVFAAGGDAAGADTGGSSSAGNFGGLVIEQDRCVDGTIVGRVLFAQDGLTATTDPLLRNGSLTGTAVAEGFEFRIPGCDEPDFDAIEEVALGTVPIPTTITVTATGDPQPDQFVAAGGVPACPFGVGEVFVGDSASATGSLGGDLPLLVPTDLSKLGRTEFAGIGAGAVAFFAGCEDGDDDVRTKLVRLARQRVG